MGRVKDLYIEEHEKAIEKYLEEHPDADEEEAYNNTSDIAFRELGNRMADMADEMNDRIRDSGLPT